MELEKRYFQDGQFSKQLWKKNVLYVYSISRSGDIELHKNSK